MSATITRTDTQPVGRTTTGRGDSTARSILAATAVSGLLAATATTAIAAVARAAGADLAVDGEQIPLAGFVPMTLIGAVIGGLLAVVLARRARRPQRTFAVTTLALTALSIVPDFTMTIAVVDSVVLAGTHAAAAAIIVPAVARRLPG